MTNTLNFGHVAGLTAAEQQQLSDLAEAYSYHQSRNATKDKYYEGHVTLQDVNLGIALPKGLNKLEVGCNWGQKAVDALASRSMFDGFVGNGGALDGLQKLVTDNRLVAAYAKACRDQLKYAIAEENVDQEFLDALAEAEDGQPLKVSKALRLLLGEEQREKLYDYLRNDKGKVPIDAVMEAFYDILSNDGTGAKNS